jgi:multidrug efflux system outer membrane protein
LREVSITLLLGALLTAAGTPATALEPGSADTLRMDLATCLARALETAPALQASAAAIDESRAAASEAEARRKPVLGAAASYQYASEHMTGELETGFGLPPRSLEFGDGHVATVNVGIAFPLYTGGELSNTAAAATAGTEAATRRDGSARLDLTRAVRQAFSGALGRQSQVEAARLAVARLDRHLESVTGARAAGAATEEARLRAQARLNQAGQRLVQAEAARDSAGLALGRLVGRPGGIVHPSGDVATPLLAADDTTGLSLDERPDIAAISWEEQRQRDLAEAARGKLRPRVTGDLRAHYGRPGMDALANDWMGYATAAVSVDWPLWDAGARKDRALQAEARGRWLEAARRDLGEAVATADAGARTALRAAATQEQQAAERTDLHRRLLAMVEGRYAQMAATETELLDAFDDLTQAELDLALARTRVRLAETALLWALGR